MQVGCQILLNFLAYHTENTPSWHKSNYLSNRSLFYRFALVNVASYKLLTIVNLCLLFELLQKVSLLRTADKNRRKSIQHCNLSDLSTFKEQM